MMGMLLMGWPAWLRAAPGSFERDAIAAVLAAEARGEGVDGMKAVAEVIRNRGGDPLWQVLKPRQFSCLDQCSIVTLIRMMRRERGWENACAVAGMLLRRPAALGDRTLRATHYDNVLRFPSWAREMKRTAVIGKHAFYASN